MSITLENFELRQLLREERELTVKQTLSALGLLKSTISQSQAIKRGVTRTWLENMEKEGILTPVKRGAAKNCKVEYDLIQFEEALRTQRGNYTIK